MEFFATQNSEIDLSDQALGISQPEELLSDATALPAEGMTQDETPQETSEDTAEEVAITEENHPQKAVENPQEDDRLRYIARLEQEKRTAQLRTQELEAQLHEAQIRSRLSDPTQKEEVLKQLLADPSAYMQETMKPAVLKIVNDAMQPLLREQEETYRARTFNAGMQTIVQDFPQAGNREEQKQLIEAAVRLCHDNGDTDAALLWRIPTMVLREAATRLWGMPKTVDQAAIDAAVATALSAQKQQQERAEEAKASIPAAPAMTQNQFSEKPTQAEQILNEILSYNSKTLF